MNITISSEMKFNIAKSIILKLFNQKLITLEEFGELINRLAAIYGVSTINKKSNE
jgi:hypothetical protein